jgi:hypothetical protein
MIINDLFNNKKQGMAEGVSLKQKHEDKKRADQNQVRYGKMTQAEFDKKWTRTERPKPTDKKQGVAEGSSDTVYPNAEVIKSKNGKPVGEIYQDGNSWGAFHYRADRGYDFIDSREEAIEALKDLHQETGRSRPDYTVKGVAEGMSDDMAAMAQKKFPNAYISKDGQEVQKPENWGKRYTPPAAAPADLEKQQRDLTAKYPNIDELVRRAELNRDPDYEMADGQAYYAARDAEQNYQRLKQIQRVIQGLNESLNRSHLP